MSKVTELNVFLSSAINSSFLSYGRSMLCVSWSEKKQERKTGVQTTLHRFEIEKRSVRLGRKRCANVFEPNEVTLAGSAHRPGLSHDNQITNISQKEAEQFTLTLSSTSLSSGGDGRELNAAFLL